MFECINCGGKTKVRQTNHEMETVPVPTDPGKTFTRPIIRRKIQCLECDSYFITKEVFERETEETVRQKYGKDYQIARKTKPTKIRLDRSLLFEGKALTPVNLDEWKRKITEDFNDDGSVYSEVQDDKP